MAAGDGRPTVMHAGLRADELAFLERAQGGTLARIATVGRAVMPLVVPLGWSFDADASELVLGGRDAPATARWQHVERTGVAAVVIDGVAGADRGAFQPWCITMRGTARTSPAERAIRFAPRDVHSFGLEALAQAAEPE